MTTLIAALLGDDPEMARRWNTSALFRAKLIAIAQDILPALVLGLAVESDLHAEEYERLLAQRMNSTLLTDWPRIRKEIS